MWMDLFIDPSQPRRTSAVLHDQIRDAVSDGRLVAGDRLPTSRSLADELGIARSTVTMVYSRLTAEGVLDARIGDGTFVARQWTRPSNPGRRRPPSGTGRRPDAAPGHGTAASEIDLRTGRPDPRLFPMAAWRRAVRAATALAPPGYGEPAGAPELRTAIAARLRRVRGLTVTADQVLITAGAQQAFDLLARVLTTAGDIVAIENPGYEPARRAFTAGGARIQPVPVDRQGIVADQIDPSARVVYVTPSHQSPTGVTMSSSRRRALLDCAYRDDLLVVEDDYDTEFRYVDRPLEPLHRLDPDGRVIYVGSFSKTLSPSIRIGFLVASSTLVDTLTEVRRAVDVQPPHLTQAALTHLITSGDFDRHIRRAAATYRVRHQLVTARLVDLHRCGSIPLPWLSNAGLHSMIELHPDTDTGRLHQRLIESGLVIDSTDHTWLGPRPPGLILGYGLADLPSLAHAFDVLASSL